MSFIRLSNVAFAVTGLLALTSAAQAGTGICLINPIVASGTYAFSGTGLSVGPNPLAPPGQFPQAGTVSQTVSGYSKVDARRKVDSGVAPERLLQCQT